MNCPKCGLPKFFGIGGYAGPQCLCDVMVVPTVTIGEVPESLKLNDPLYKEGFQAGAASRDAEIHHLQMALADTEALEAGTAERCDQLREQVALLREEVTRCRDWFEAQAKVKSKGSPSSWEFMLLRDERDAADEALAATEPKP